MTKEELEEKLVKLADLALRQSDNIIALVQHIKDLEKTVTDLKAEIALQ